MPPETDTLTEAPTPPVPVREAPPRQRTAKRGLAMAAFAMVESVALLMAVVVARSNALPAPALVAVVGALAGIGGVCFLLMMFTVMRPEAARRPSRPASSTRIAAAAVLSAQTSDLAETQRNAFAKESPRARRHRNAIERVARELGLTYTPKAARAQRKPLSILAGLPAATDIRHILRGELAGAAVTCLQHTYLMSTGQGTVPVVTTALIAQAPARWPMVRINPAGPLTRLLRRLGLLRTIQLDLDAFNHAFAVRSADEEFALLLLTPAVQEHLLASSAKLKWRIGEGAVRALARGKMQPRRLTEQLKALEGVLERIPPELHAWPGRGD
ncbi:MAG: hypothetical protein D6824_07855 [Planctomycetota bacterium]|nr:MAG: hypothetical protein D6824_07855 [Planctomycetota bacterium]